MNNKELKNKLKDRFGKKSIVEDFEELTLTINVNDVKKNCKILRDEFDFDILIDLCAIDYLTFNKAEWDANTEINASYCRSRQKIAYQSDYKKRFAVVYHLLSVKNNLRLRVKTYLKKNLLIDSVVDVWNVADWFEREAFDLFGVLFKGHPDLRRILTDYGFVGHPLRKDFPLIGEVEMRYDKKSNRVVYEPVTIEEVINVPKVIR